MQPLLPFPEAVLFFAGAERKILLVCLHKPCRRVLCIFHKNFSTSISVVLKSGKNSLQNEIKMIHFTQHSSRFVPIQQSFLLPGNWFLHRISLTGIGLSERVRPPCGRRKQYESQRIFEGFCRNGSGSRRNGCRSTGFLCSRQRRAHRCRSAGYGQGRTEGRP